MKDATNSPALSPVGKKLVQARLPFKVVAPASPATPATSTTPLIARKRKLSVTTDSASKVTKPSKENDLEDLVILSDDDETAISVGNPYLTMVDKAIKKKLQKKRHTNKNKESRSKKNRKSSKKSSGNKYKDVDNDVVLVDEPEEDENSEPLNGIEVEVEIHEDSKEKLVENKSELLKSSNDDSNCKIISDIGLIDGNNKSFETPVLMNESSLAENIEAEVKHLSSENKHLNVQNINEDTKNGNTDKEYSQNKTEGHGVEVQLIDDDSNDPSQKESQLPSTPTMKNKQKDLNTPKPQVVTVTCGSSMEQENNITPCRRSDRKKATVETEQGVNLANSPSDSVTPKRRAIRSLDGGDCNESVTPATSTLTPKQLQRKLESAKKREQKEKERLEREKKRLEEKEERNKVKQEKEDQKKKEREDREEQKRKEKEEKEEQKRKEKEEKEKQKELERKEREEKEEQKRKEREEKEEQRRKEKEAREEEKRKKLEAFEEEKRQRELEKQEQELKIKKASVAFVNFFVPKQKLEQTESVTQSKNPILSSFAVKSDMRLAPIVRGSIDDTQKNELDVNLKSQDLSKRELYLHSIRNKIIKPKSSQKTWPLDDKEDECMIIDEDELPSTVLGSGEVMVATEAVRERLRPKLLSFHENRRPPYWGTWRKKSSAVAPRRPFGTDSKLLDYELDSDCEWEDEADGESIAGSAAGSLDDERDEYEVDNDLFVPHGYLSDEEGTMDGEVLSLSPETQKAKLKHLEDEFEFEMKKPTEKLKPRLYGMLWENGEGGKPENCIDALWNYFGRMAMIMEDPTPLLRPAPASEETEKKKAARKRPLEDTGSPRSADRRKKAKPVKKEEVKMTENVKNQRDINSFLMKMKT